MAANDDSGRLMSTVTQLSPIHKITLGAAALTLVAGLFVFTGARGESTAMAVAYTDLEAADAASVTDALIARDVEYELADGGRTVLVPRDSVYDLRISLSGQGLPSSNEGYALLDKQGITTSEFRQRIDYQRALEGELSRTLRAIDGVENVTVHLALPDDSVFVQDTTDPTASVLVTTTDADSITNDQVAAMVHLVAASVKDMKPDNVTIADSAGRVLTDGTGGPSAGAATSGADDFERNLAEELRMMVGRFAGFQNVAVNVQADLEMTEREEVSERFDSTDEDGVLYGERVSNETYSGADAALAAEAGVLGPDGSVLTPDAVDGEADAVDGEVDTVDGTVDLPAGGDTSYVKDDAERTYAVNRTVEQVRFAPGTVNRLSVAVLVDENVVSAAQSEEIATMIATAAGIDPARGDQLSVTRLPFTVADVGSAEEAALEAAALAKADQQNSLIRTGIIAFVVVIALFLAYRSTRKSRQEVSTPIDIGAIRSAPIGEATPVGAGTAEVRPASAVGDLALASDQDPTAMQELSMLADREPAEVAQILQSWLADEKSMS